MSKLIELTRREVLDTLVTRRQEEVRARVKELETERAELVAASANKRAAAETAAVKKATDEVVRLTARAAVAAEGKPDRRDPTVQVKVVTTRPEAVERLKAGQKVNNEAVVVPAGTVKMVGKVTVTATIQADVLATLGRAMAGPVARLKRFGGGPLRLNDVDCCGLYSPKFKPGVPTTLASIKHELEFIGAAEIAPPSPLELKMGERVAEIEAELAALRPVIEGCGADPKRLFLTMVDRLPLAAEPHLDVIGGMLEDAMIAEFDTKPGRRTPRK